MNLEQILSTKTQLNFLKDKGFKEISDIVKELKLTDENEKVLTKALVDYFKANKVKVGLAKIKQLVDLIKNEDNSKNKQGGYKELTQEQKEQKAIEIVEILKRTRAQRKAKFRPSKLDPESRKFIADHGIKDTIVGSMELIARNMIICTSDFVISTTKSAIEKNKSSLENANVKEYRKHGIGQDSIKMMELRGKVTDARGSYTKGNTSTKFDLEFDVIPNKHTSKQIENAEILGSALSGKTIPGTTTYGALSNSVVWYAFGMNKDHGKMQLAVITKPTSQDPIENKSKANDFYYTFYNFVESDYRVFKHNEDLTEGNEGILEILFDHINNGTKINDESFKKDFSKQKKKSKDENKEESEDKNEEESHHEENKEDKKSNAESNFNKDDFKVIKEIWDGITDTYRSRTGQRSSNDEFLDLLESKWSNLSYKEGIKEEDYIRAGKDGIDEFLNNRGFLLLFMTGDELFDGTDVDEKEGEILEKILDSKVVVKEQA